MDAVQATGVAINLLSGLLFVGAILSGASAWMVYRRLRFVEEMSNRVRRFRVREKRPPFK